MGALLVHLVVTQLQQQILLPAADSSVRNFDYFGSLDPIFFYLKYWILGFGDLEPDCDFSN